MTQTLERRPAAPRLAAGIEPLLERLAAIGPDGRLVVSCYVRLEPRDRTRTRYLTAIRSRIRDLEADPMILAADPAQQRSLRRDLGRIVRSLDRPARLPPARGLALFACEPLDLFEALPLPRVHRTRLVVDETPSIAELAALRHETEPVIVALLDRAHLRFFAVTPMEAQEMPCAVTPARRGGKFHSDREDAPGWGEHAYHRRLEEERHRHYALAAERLEELAREHRARGILLAGPSDHTAGLARFLTGRLPELVLGRVKVNPTAATAAEVQAAVMAATEEHERKAVLEEVRALEEALGTGWALDDARDTLRALARGQVRTLFVQEGFSAGGYRCAASGRLVLAKGECGGEGEPVPVRDVVDDAIEEALRRRARVVVVPRQADAGIVDGLAAILRFR